MVPIDIGYGGAGLAVGGVVVQFIVGTETLALCPAAYAAGDVEFALHHIAPDAGYGRLVGAVVHHGGYIGHTAVQVSCAYGMSHYLVLFQYRAVVLAVHAGVVSVCASARLIDKVARLYQVAAGAFGINASGLQGRVCQCP